AVFEHVAGPVDVVERAGHDPDPGPHALDLERGELGGGVALGRDLERLAPLRRRPVDRHPGARPGLAHPGLADAHRAPRISRPGWAPVASPRSRVTSPDTTVAT